MKTLYTFFLLFAFVLAKAQTPTITFNNVTKTYGDAPFYMTASSNSSGAISYSIQDTTIAKIDQTGFVVIKKGGSTAVTATQAASSPFASASKTATLLVNKATVFAVNFTSPNTVYANDSLSLTATSNFADAKYSFSIKNQSSTNATIKGAKLYAGSSTGTLDITGDVVADANFNAGTVSSSNSQTITVQASSGAPEIVLENKTVSFGTAPFNMVATSNSNGLLSYSIDTDTSVSVSLEGLIVIKKPGKTTIYVHQEAFPPYFASKDSATLIVLKETRYLYISSIDSLNVNDSLKLTLYPASYNNYGRNYKINWKIASQSGTNARIIGEKLFGGSSAGTLEIYAEIEANDTAYSICQPQKIYIHAEFGTPTIKMPDILQICTGRYGGYFKNVKATSNSMGSISYKILNEPSVSIDQSGKLYFANFDSIFYAFEKNNNRQLAGKNILELVIEASQEASPPYDAAIETSKYTIKYEVLTGIEESNTSLSKPIAYPNPVKDILQIKSGKGAGCEATISLYNMNGIEQNTSSTRNGDDYQLDISEMPSGVYSLKMTYCNEVFTQKVVKQ